MEQVIRQAVAEWTEILKDHGSKEGGWMQMNQVMVHDKFTNRKKVREALEKKYKKKIFTSFSKEYFQITTKNSGNSFIKLKDNSLPKISSYQDKQQLKLKVKEFWIDIVKKFKRKTTLSDLVTELKLNFGLKEFGEIKSILSEYGSSPFKCYAETLFKLTPFGTGSYYIELKEKDVKNTGPVKHLNPPKIDTNIPLFFPFKEESELEQLMFVLPHHIQKYIKENINTDHLVDIILDLDCEITFILHDGRFEYEERMSIATEEDIKVICSACKHITDANRACIETSLHRCSVIKDPFQKDRNGEKIVGMTIRVSRIITGLAETIHDILESKKSILLIGTPGCGKTTLLRDIAQYVASRDKMRRRTMIVDTNNEIGGESTRTHKAVGDARRMKVGPRERQYRVMLEAVQNHTPQCLIIDEIGTTDEANQAVSISQRGIQLIATTHGTTLAGVVQNPATRNLLGGANIVTLSATECISQGAEKKTRVERKTLPSFQVVIELISRSKWRIHHNVLQSVDVILKDMGTQSDCEIREFDFDNKTYTRTDGKFPEPEN